MTVVDFVPSTPPAWRSLFVDCLSICAAAEVVKLLLLDRNDPLSPLVPTRIFDNARRRRAHAIVTHELLSRLSFSHRDHSPGPNHFAFFYRAGEIVGHKIARYFLNFGPSRPHGFPGCRLPQIPGPESQYLAAIHQAIGDATALCNAVAAQHAVNVVVDGTLAADAAASLADTRATYLAVLQTRFPEMGYA